MVISWFELEVNIFDNFGTRDLIETIIPKKDITIQK